MTDREKLEKIKSLADKMYTSMQNLTSDTTPIRKAMDEYHQFIINEYHKEEPTIPEIVDDHFDEMLDDENEELDKAAKRYATEGDEISGLYVIEPEVDAFKAGAKWQRKQIREELFTMLNTSIDNEQFFEQLDEFIDELEKEDSV